MDINAYMLLHSIATLLYCVVWWDFVSFPYYPILPIFKPFNFEATLNIGFNPAYPFIERLILYGCNNFTTWVSNPLKTPSYSLLFQHPQSPQIPTIQSSGVGYYKLRSDGLVLFLLYYPYVYYIGYWVCYRMDIKKGYYPLYWVYPYPCLIDYYSLYHYYYIVSH